MHYIPTYIFEGDQRSKMDVANELTAPLLGDDEPNMSRLEAKTMTNPKQRRAILVKAGSDYNFILSSQARIRRTSLLGSSVSKDVEEGSALGSAISEEDDEDELDFILPKLNICILVVGTRKLERNISVQE